MLPDDVKHSCEQFQAGQVLQIFLIDDFEQFVQLLRIFRILVWLQLFSTMARQAIDLLGTLRAVAVQYILNKTKEVLLCFFTQSNDHSCVDDCDGDFLHCVADDFSDSCSLLPSLNVNLSQ